MYGTGGVKEGHERERERVTGRGGGHKKSGGWARGEQKRSRQGRERRAVTEVEDEDEAACSTEKFA